MDEKRNNRTVERKVKDALKHDRARIQVGPISHFGLLEMSRQRIRSSVLESTTEKCPECGGTGHIRSVSSVSLQLLRGLEETLIKSATHNLIVRTKSNVALYVLNHKRAHLRALEERFKLTISVNADDSVTGPLPFTIDRGEQVHTPEAAKALVVQPDSIMPEVDDDEVEIEAEVETEAPEPQAAEAAPAEREQQPHAEGEENGTRRRRRRRRRGRGSSEPREGTPAGAHPAGPSEAMSPEGESDEGDEGEDSEDVAESGAFVPATDDQPHPVEASFNNGGANGAGGTKGESNGESGRRRRGRRGRRGRGGGSREGGHEDEYRQDRPEHAAGPESYVAGATSDRVSDSSPAETAGDSAHPPVDQFEVRPMTVDAESPMPRSFGGEPAAPMPTQAPPSVTVPAAAPEPPRRRSTIREPAPVFGEQGTAPAPSPQPAPPPPPAMPEAEANVATSADDGKPRRSGWWSRRG
jgi:ribonuclease E